VRNGRSGKKTRLRSGRATVEVRGDREAEGSMITTIDERRRYGDDAGANFKEVFQERLKKEVSPREEVQIRATGSGPWREITVERTSL